MDDGFERHIVGVTARHAALAHESRLVGGARLFGQFEDAVASYSRRHGPAQISAVIERVNELTVARHLLEDATLPTAVIEYEPEVVPGGRRFDFRALENDQAEALYIEVKTVAPRTADTSTNWQKARRRLEHVSRGNVVIVAEQWMGAAIAGNAFASRSSFVTYTAETEAKLALHAAVAPGHAILVFCGTGFHWHISELEDFADFYATGRHRPDDPYAAMEAHAIAEEEITLARTLLGFAAFVRQADETMPSKVCYPVRGPAIP